MKTIFERTSLGLELKIKPERLSEKALLNELVKENCTSYQKMSRKSITSMKFRFTQNKGNITGIYLRKETKANALLLNDFEIYYDKILFYANSKNNKTAIYCPLMQTAWVYNGLLNFYDAEYYNNDKILVIDGVTFYRGKKVRTYEQIIDFFRKNRFVP